MLQRKIIVTKEGTKTLHIPEWNESYHSQHGILQEARHVFILNGLQQLNISEINVLEMGFGTGLNTFLTMYEAAQKKIRVNYYTLEKYPVSKDELEDLEYWKLISENVKNEYFALHEAEWGKETEITPYFNLSKFNIDFFDLFKVELPPINLVYYDAFGARVQPDFWEEAIFKQLYEKMTDNSLLTTYSSKGSARRAMQSARFEVEKKAGPEGKREMVNAWKR